MKPLFCRLVLPFLFLAASAQAAPDLFTAVQRGDLAAVRSLVAAGAPVNETFEGDTPLVYSLRFSHPEIADFLCASGAEGRRCTGYVAEATKALGECSANDWAPVPWATCVRDALAAGADPNFEFNYGRVKWQLNFAIAVKKIDVVQMLLAAGANIESQANSYGVGNNITALMEAAYSGDPEIVKLLLQKGANPNARDGSGYFSPLDVAVYKETPSPGPVVRLLVPLSTRETRDRLIEKMLREPHLFVEYGIAKANEEILPLLMEGVGANIDLCYGPENLLVRAARDPSKYERKFRVLLELGANPRGCRDQDLPMRYVAAWSNRLDLVQALIDKGAPATSDALMNVLDNWGSDPKGPSRAIARFLLDHGADPQGSCGYPCPDYAGPHDSVLDWIIWKLLQEHSKLDLGALDFLLQYVTEPRRTAMWQVMEHAGPRYDSFDREHPVKPDPFAKLREDILERLLRFKNIDLNSSYYDGLYDDYFLVRAMGAPHLAKMLVAAGESAEPPKYSLLWRWLGHYPGLLSLEGFQFLLEQGAKPTRDEAIVCALAGNLRDDPQDLRAFELLKKYGMDAAFIDQAECAYNTRWGRAIHAAAYRHHTALVAAFLKLGVNPKLKDRRGQTALDIAKEQKFADLVALLEKNGG